MSFNSDYTLTYVSGNKSWQVKPSELPAEQQAVVLQALKDGKLDATELATLAQLQQQFPQAFAQRNFLDNLPPPESFAVSRFSTSWSGMDVDAVMAFVNELLTKLSAEMRERASKQQIGQAEHTMELAEQKKTADTNAAADARTAALVSAILAIIGSVVNLAGAAASQGISAKDLVKAKDLATNKAKALCDKFKHQRQHESFERNARKADEQASLAHKAAADAHPIGLQSSSKILKKQQELMTTDTNGMSKAQKAAHQKEIEQVTTALECKKKAEAQETIAANMHASAATERRRMERAEKRLSAIEDETRQLEAHTQKTANFFRMFPMITDMVGQFGHIGGAMYTENSKLWEALSNYLSAQAQNSEFMADLFKGNAQAMKDLGDAVREIFQKYLEGQNQANAQIAAHI